MNDLNYKSIADVDGFILRDTTVNSADGEFPPEAYSDVLKFSHASNGRVENVIVDGHAVQKENAIDMNRECANVGFKGLQLISGKQNAITVKGGCSNITFQDTEIVPGHGHCDVELGNWSDQSKKRTTGITLQNVWRSDNEPIRLRVGNADYPTVIDCKVDYLWFQSLLLKAYLFFKGLSA